MSIAISAEVAIVAEGRLRSAGRIETRPEALELFAQSLAAGDWVALEVTGNAWAIARILEAHVARVIVASPNDTSFIRAPSVAGGVRARADVAPQPERAAKRGHAAYWGPATDSRRTRGPAARRA